MEINEKMVYYNEWCDKCKHWNVVETEDPCNDCLNTPVNADSRKPVRWEEK